MNKPDLNLTEIKVLRNCGRGLSQQASADDLGITHAQWLAYRGHAMRKLGALNMTHAYSLARDAGLIETRDGVAHVAVLERFAPKEATSA